MRDGGVIQGNIVILTTAVDLMNLVGGSALLTSETFGTGSRWSSEDGLSKEMTSLLCVRIIFVSLTCHPQDNPGIHYPIVFPIMTVECLQNPIAT